MIERFTFEEAAGDELSFVTALRRVEHFGKMIIEAHRLGTEPGDVDAPWTEAGQRLLVPIFSSALPAWYQHGVADWFGESANYMLRRSAPIGFVEEWSLVERFLRSVSIVIREVTPPLDGSEQPGFERRAQPPAVVDFSRIASTVTRNSMRTLTTSAIAVRVAIESVDCPFDEPEQRALELFAEGRPVAEIARSIGYSRRTAYRIVDRMQAKVGVSSRDELIALATNEGWIGTLERTG